MTVGFEFCYATKFYFSVSADGRKTEFGPFIEKMDTAIEMANGVIEKFSADEIACCDANTGEVIFIARAHDDECVEEVDDNSLYYDDPDEWMDEVGFDPYVGGYTFDC